jgi:3-deoxy-manno-octulosonate cytidylyltransferase (CMP-KDO synthetase)
MSTNANSFAAIIPARYASTRFPGKPLSDIHGKPMIQHVYERAQQVFDQCAVATDDTRIAAVVESFGGKVIMTSPSHQSGTDRCAEAATVAKKTLGWKFDVVVNVQGDEPFMHINQLNQICTCFQNPETDIATLIKKIETEAELFDPNKPKVVTNQQGKALYFSRNPIPYLRGKENSEWLQNHTYYKHIGMYAYKVETLQAITQLSQSSLELSESLEQLRWLENGYEIQTAITDIENLSVDTPADLEAILRLGKL